MFIKEKIEEALNNVAQNVSGRHGSDQEEPKVDGTAYAVLTTLYGLAAIGPPPSPVSFQVRKDVRDDSDRATTAVRDPSYWSNLLGRYADGVGKKLAYLLATGNIISRSGLDLMQVG